MVYPYCSLACEPSLILTPLFLRCIPSQVCFEPLTRTRTPLLLTPLELAEPSQSGPREAMSQHVAEMYRQSYRLSPCARGDEDTPMSATPTGGTGISSAFILGPADPCNKRASDRVAQIPSLGKKTAAQRCAGSCLCAGHCHGQAWGNSARVRFRGRTRSLRACSRRWTFARCNASGSPR
jgi:hypothetical protein